MIERWQTLAAVEHESAFLRHLNYKAKAGAKAKSWKHMK
jgi:hypothetical protein